METASNVKIVGIYNFTKCGELSRSVPTFSNDGSTRAETSMKGEFTSRGTYYRSEFCTFPLCLYLTVSVPGGKRQKVRYGKRKELTCEKLLWDSYVRYNIYMDKDILLLLFIVKVSGVLKVLKIGLK